VANPITSSNTAIRDATAHDVAKLAAIRYGEAVHRDRVSAADGKCLHYLVVTEGEDILGFGCVVLSQPPSWPTVKHLPQIIDLYIRPERRSQGLGQAFIRTAEAIARRAGCAEMWLAAEPEANPRALALYERLGYTAVNTVPVEEHWEFVDSDGVRHSGIEHLIRTNKQLR